MKKLIVSLVIASAVWITQAGTVSWNMTGLGTAGAGGSMVGSTASGDLIYAFVGTTTEASAAATAAAGGATTWNAFVAGYAATEKLGSIATVSGAAVLGGQGSFVSMPVSVYLVAFDAGSVAAAGYYLVSSPQVQTFGASGNKTYSFGTPGGSYIPSTWSPIPEPTSMALFGLGAVVLGLRRKFRKS